MAVNAHWVNMAFMDFDQVPCIASAPGRRKDHSLSGLENHLEECTQV